MMKTLATLAAATLAITLISPAMAQDDFGQRGQRGGQRGGQFGGPGGPGGQRGPGGPMQQRQGNPAMLLMHPGVQKELNLLESQIVDIRKLVGPKPGGERRGEGRFEGGQRGGQRGGGQGEFRGGQRGGPGGPGRPGGPGGPGQPDKVMKEIKEILNKKQFARFEQILLQQQGAMALGRDNVAEEVGLSDKQLREVREIIRENMPRGPMGPGGRQGGQGGPGRLGDGQRQRGGQRGDARGGQRRGSDNDGFRGGQRRGSEGGPAGDMQARKKKVEAKILSVLNKDQKSKWQKMLGKPFKLTRPERGDGPRDRRGGGGRIDR